MKLAALLVTTSLFAGYGLTRGSSLNATEQSGAYELHQRAWDPARASDDEWNKAVCKGQQLLDAIKANNRDASQQFSPNPSHSNVQSPFTNLADLPAFGYFEYDGNELNHQNGKFSNDGWGVAVALHNMGKSWKVKGDGDGKISVAWVHHGPGWEKDTDGRWSERDVTDKTYHHEGKFYKFTNAYYEYGINEDEGVILALVRKSPEFQSEGWPKDQYPDFRRASDIMYLLWKKQCTKKNIQLNSLRNFMSVQITNGLTKRLISRAIETDTLEEWPGHPIEWSDGGGLSEKGLALLGSPTSQGLAYMLIQHKEDLGSLRPIGVIPFKTDSEQSLASLLWILKDAPPGAPA